MLRVKLWWHLQIAAWKKGIVHLTRYWVLLLAQCVTSLLYFICFNFWEETLNTAETWQSNLIGLLRKQIWAMSRSQMRAYRPLWLCRWRSLRKTAATASLRGTRRALISLTRAVVLGCDSMCKHFQVFVFASRPLTLYSESTPACVFGWICDEEQSGFKGEPVFGLCKAGGGGCCCVQGSCSSALN